MKASIPFEFTDADRQLVARFLGYQRPASHIECVAWARGQLRGSLEVMAQARPRPLADLPWPGALVIRDADPRD